MIEATRQKGSGLLHQLAFDGRKLFEIALGVAIAIERPPEAAALKLTGKIIEIGLGQPGRKLFRVDETVEEPCPRRTFDRVRGAAG